MRHLLLAATLLLLPLTVSADDELEEIVKVRVSHLKVSVEIPNEGDHPIRCHGSVEGVTVKGRTLTKKGVRIRVMPGDVEHTFLYYDGVEGDSFSGGSAKFSCHVEK